MIQNYSSRSRQIISYHSNCNYLHPPIFQALPISMLQLSCYDSNTLTGLCMHKWLAHVLCKLTNHTFIQVLHQAIKQGWTPTAGEQFKTFPKEDNTSDRHAVAVLNEAELVWGGGPLASRNLCCRMICLEAQGRDHRRSMGKRKLGSCNVESKSQPGWNCTIQEHKCWTRPRNLMFSVV